MLSALRILEGTAVKPLNAVSVRLVQKVDSFHLRQCQQGWFGLVAQKQIYNYIYNVCYAAENLFYLPAWPHDQSTKHFLIIIQIFKFYLE